MSIQLPPRSAIKKADTWNAESVFPDHTAWQAEYQSISQTLPELEAFKGKLSDGPGVVADALEKANKLRQRVRRLFVYAGISTSVDTTDEEAAALVSQAQGLSGQAMAAASFLQPELLAIGESTLRQWVKDERRLADYAHYVDDLFRQQAHVRSAEVEEILGLVNDPLGSVSEVASKLTNADFTFAPAKTSEDDEIPLGQGTIRALMDHPDRDARRTAWENYNDKYLEFKNTLATNLAAAIKRDVFFARARRHNSSLEASLFRYNIPPAVFHNLVETYKTQLPTWHRYWRARRKALGVETLHPYDVWAPLTPNQPVVPFEQAVEWIANGMKPLGHNYVETLRRGCLQERWVDKYPNEGKRNGAFSSGAPGTHPFIMMSYAEDLRGMSTLAHELGHSMHSYYTWQNQPDVYARYSLFVAEVASNFNQAMTRDYLFKEKDDRDFQIALIEEAMANFHRYFFIMPTLARFELEVHERAEKGQGLTAGDMISLMADLFAEGYGGEMAVDRERVGITWAQFGHLYANFYVFQYATGISGAHALAERVIAGEPNAADDYIAFLSAGSSLYPLDALERAGVDLRTPAAVEKTFGVMAEMINRLEELTG